MGLINMITPTQGTEETMTVLPSLRFLDGEERFTRNQVRDILRKMKEHLGYEVDWNYTSEDDEDYDDYEDDDEGEYEEYPGSGTYMKEEGMYEYRPTQDDDGDLDSDEDLKDPPQIKEETQGLDDGMQMETGNTYD